jgi:hypothetical protein
MDIEIPATPVDLTMLERRFREQIAEYRRTGQPCDLLEQSVEALLRRAGPVKDDDAR